MKKILTSLLLVALLFSSIPSKASALTIVEIQELIKVLQAQLIAMQGQTTQQPGGDTTTSCPTFSINLSEGSEDVRTSYQVSALQKFLVSKNLLTKENVTGYFGPLTRKALMEYQWDNALALELGNFGPMTRAAVNADCGSTTSSAKIRLLSPNGGEMLNEGENFTIKWEAFNLPADSKIRLIVSKGDKLAIGNRNKEIVDLPSSFNSYTWKVEAYSVNGNGWGVGKISVPEKIAKIFGIPSANADIVNNQYVIHIGVINKEGDKSIANDISDKPFVIFGKNESKFFSINFPTNGSKLVAGKTYTISWTGSDSKVSEYDVLLTGGKFSEYTKIGTAYPRTDGTVGTFSWTVPKDLVSASDYRIHLAGGQKGLARSEKFSVVSSEEPVTKFQITFPNAGAGLIAERSHRIMWSGWDYYNGAKVTKFSVYLVGGKLGSNGSRLLGTVDLDKQDWFEWKIPADLATASNYQIQFSGVGATGDNSDNFSIVSYDDYAQIDNVKVLYNGSQVSQIITGNKYTIAWEEKNTSSGLKTKVRLDWLNSNREWVSVYEIGSVSGSGSGKNSITWSVPPDLKIFDGRYQVFVNYPGAGGSQEVVLVNSSTPPPTPVSSLRVLSPNGGETVTLGNPYTINWSSTGSLISETSVALLSEDSTLTNNKQIGWLGPVALGKKELNWDGKTACAGFNGPGKGVGCFSIQPGKYKIAIYAFTGNGNNTVSDISDSAFKIISTPTDTSSISISSPNSADLVTIGSKVKVEWTTVNIPTTETFLIRLRSVSSGQEYNLVSGVLNDQSENVVISPTLPEGYYKLEMKSSKSIIGTSGAFKVGSAPTPTPTPTQASLPTVKVLDPNISQNLVEGSIFTIKWTATDAATVDLRLYHSETSTYDIIKGIPNTGSYNWKVSRMGTGQRGTYAIGVKAINGPVSAYDTSDQQFNIISSTTSSPVSSEDRANQLANIQATINSLLEALKALPN